MSCSPRGPASGIVAMSTRHELERFCLEAVPVPLREGPGQAQVAGTRPFGGT